MLRGHIGTLDGSIDDLETDVDDLASSIDGLETDITNSSDKTRLKTLKSRGSEEKKCQEKEKTATEDTDGIETAPNPSLKSSSSKGKKGSEKRSTDKKVAMEEKVKEGNGLIKANESNDQVRA